MRPNESDIECIIFMTVDLVQDGAYGGHVTDIDDLVSVMREQLSDLRRVPTVVVSRFLEEFHWFTRALPRI